MVTSSFKLSRTALLSSVILYMPFFVISNSVYFVGMYVHPMLTPTIAAMITNGSRFEKKNLFLPIAESCTEFFANTLYERIRNIAITEII